MSARAVSLRALVFEDCARTADRAGLRCAARILRRAEVDDSDLGAVCADLRESSWRAARCAGSALMKLRIRSGIHAAVEVLAEFCGIDAEEWLDTTREEQGVEVVSAAVIQADTWGEHPEALIEARLEQELDAETAPVWAGLQRCGGDALDREVVL